MAAGLGYKEFATGDVLTATDLNGYLASQVVMVFTSASARTSAISSPQEGMVSYLKDTNSIEYYSGSAWVAVGGGGSSGKIAQVVFASTATQTSTTSTSYVDVTNLTASITPSASTSKVLVMATVGASSNGAAYSATALQLVRGSTSIADYGNNKVYAGGSFTQNFNVVTMNWLDSPTTTSSTTYKVQMKTQSGLTSWVNRSGENDLSSIILMEVLA